jgi:hypothetical protein
VLWLIDVTWSADAAGLMANRPFRGYDVHQIDARAETRREIDRRSQGGRRGRSAVQRQKQAADGCRWPMIHVDRFWTQQQDRPFGVGDQLLRHATQRSTVFYDAAMSGEHDHVDIWSPGGLKDGWRRGSGVRAHLHRFIWQESHVQALPHCEVRPFFFGHVPVVSLAGKPAGADRHVFVVWIGGAGEVVNGETQSSLRGLVAAHLDVTGGPAFLPRPRMARNYATQSLPARASEGGIAWVGSGSARWLRPMRPRPGEPAFAARWSTLARSTNLGPNGRLTARRSVAGVRLRKPVPGEQSHCACSRSTDRVRS